MKNGLSAGVDELNDEFIKYATQEIHKSIADILNYVAETGDFPEEIKLGILTPLQKPDKNKVPPENLRPIVLFFSYLCYARSYQYV